MACWEFTFQSAILAYARPFLPNESPTSSAKAARPSLTRGKLRRVINARRVLHITNLEANRVQPIEDPSRSKSLEGNARPCPSRDGGSSFPSTRLIQRFSPPLLFGTARLTTRAAALPEPPAGIQSTPSDRITRSCVRKVVSLNTHEIIAHIDDPNQR